MLVLSRRCGETIHFEVNGIEFTVCLVGIKQLTAKIGIDAPQDVKVVRTELLAKEAQDEAR